MAKLLKANNVIFVATRSVVAEHLSGSIPYQSYLPQVKQQITDMAVNGSGMRDTARVLKISRNTVTEELKKIFNSCVR
jgi:transposase-like protein